MIYLRSLKKTTVGIAFGLALALTMTLAYACGKDNNGSEPEEPDTTAPAEVTNQTGVPADGQVTLSWTDPVDADFSKVEITYTPGNGNVEINKGVQTAAITSLTNGTAYTFTIRTVDETGNRSTGVTSGPHIPLGADPGDTTPPAEVTGFNGTAGNGSVALTWVDPTDTDFTKVIISYTPGTATAEIGQGTQAATITGLTNGTEYTFTIKTVDASDNQSAGVNAGPYTPEAGAVPTVYMTTDISSDGLMAIYRALGRTPAQGQKVGVKITTGEGTNSNHLRPDFIRALVTEVGGDIIECNTAYGGNRASTAMHEQVARDRGYTDIATVVIMDGQGTMDIPVTDGRRLTTRGNRVGARFADYDFHVVLSHFKGHAMAGFGGALKMMSIGYGSTAGKCNIHSAGNSWTSPWGGAQDPFLESMAEAAKSIVDYAGSENFIYINVMNRLSVDCDCNGNPAAPTMADIGILASLDPVALDKACLDLIEASTETGSTALKNRIRTQNGPLVVTHAAEIGLGSLEYTLQRIDQ